MNIFWVVFLGLSLILTGCKFHSPHLKTMNNSFYISSSQLSLELEKANDGEIASILKLVDYYGLYEFNYDEELRWLRRAAEAGHGMSQYNLAINLISTGERENEAEIVLWLKRASASGIQGASERLYEFLNDKGLD